MERLLEDDQSADTALEPFKLDVQRSAMAALDDVGVDLPEAIGPYRVLRRLGAGGMGIVYLAEQNQPRRQIAVKVLRPGVLSREMARRFEFEAQVLGRLRHAGIAHIYEAGTTGTGDDKLSFFAMEYVDGMLLNRFVEQEQLDIRAVLGLVARVCDAVQHAHQQGVIHRDLKPGNILVDTAGNPKILDFGVARATDGDVQMATLQTDVGHVVGTIPYMSPEQVSGMSSDIDTRSDVYALGVVLYELLGKRLPHDLSRRLIAEAARIIQEDDPASLGQLHSTLRGDIETIVAKAMAKDKSRRYQSAKELADDLRRYLEYEPIVARKASSVYQLRKFARRHRGIVVGLGVAVLALITGSTVALWQAIEARSAQRIAEQRFEDLHGFAHKVIFDYKRLQRTKGQTAAREFLTKTTQHYLDNMARDTRGLDLELLQDLALAYSEIGDVMGLPNALNVGDPKAALENYQKAIEMLEDLVARDPSNIDFRRSLAICLERAGNLHLQEQNYDRALAVFQNSHALKLAIADEDPRGQRNVSFSYNKLGDVYRKMDRRDEAYDMYIASLEIRKHLARAQPDSDELQRAYTVSLGRVADVLVELDRPEEAVERYELSLQRRVDRARSQPDNARATMDLAVGHFSLGRGLARVKRLDDALAAYGSARAILRRMAEADPSNSTSWLGAAEVSGEMGRVLLDADRVADALSELTACTQEMERAMPEDKMTADMRELLAGTHQRRGEAHLALARAMDADPDSSLQHKTEGCRSLRRAQELYQSLADDDSRVPTELLAALVACVE